MTSRPPVRAGGTTGSTAEGGGPVSSKDWIEKDYYSAASGVESPPPRTRSRSRTGNWPGSRTRTTTPATARPRSGSRPSPRRTTCARRREEAPRVRRDAFAVRLGRVPAQRPRRGPAGRRARSTSPTCWGGRGGGGDQPVRRRGIHRPVRHDLLWWWRRRATRAARSPARVGTSRPRWRSTSPTRCTASRCH